MALAFAAALGVPDPAAARTAPLEARTRAVYVTAIGPTGAAVTDLTAADFTVKEGGKAREVIRAEPATAPLKIAILIDDDGTGLFRYGIAKFIDRLMGRAEFALSSVTGQIVKLTDYTASAEVLRAALDGARARPGTPDGGQLLEGISEAAQDLERRKAARPIILALTVGGEEHSTLPAHHVLDQLRQSGAALHVVAVRGGGLRSTVAVSKPSGLLDENLNLNEVLGDGPKQSGGRRDEVVASAGAAGIVPVLEQLAESLKHQYLIEYGLPDGVKPSDRLSVSVKRSGVSLRAPARIPDK